MNNLIGRSIFSNMKAKMKVGADFHRVAILLTILSGIFLTSCEDCYECDINRPEPYFNVVFIDSSRFKVVRDSITFLDSLLVVKRAEERALSPNASDEEVEALDTTIDSLNIEKKNLDEERRLVQSGSVFLDTIYSPGGGKFYHGPEPATSFRFPISMNSDSSTYYIFLGERSDTLTVYYSRELIVENGSAVIRADSILRDVKTSFPDDTIRYNNNNDLRLTNETYLYLSY